MTFGGQECANVITRAKQWAGPYVGDPGILRFELLLRAIVKDRF